MRIFRTIRPKNFHDSIHIRLFSSSSKTCYVSTFDLAKFKKDGFLVSDWKIPDEIVCRLRDRAPRLFHGDFETGIYPDEWYGREGMSLPLVSKEIFNVWKSDRWYATVSLSSAIHGICAHLGHWQGSRLAQDNIVIKPSDGGSPIHFHQDSQYVSAQFTPLSNNSVTCWIPLIDASSETGTIEYAKGSHLWPISKGSLNFHGTENSYRHPMEETAKNLGIEKVELETVNVSAGTLVFHHQNTWHGSGPNLNSTGVDRAALSFQVINSECKFREDKPITYIYGRYKRVDSTSLDSSFFPVAWHTDSSKITPFLEEYLHEKIKLVRSSA